MKFIEKLRKASAAERPGIIETLYLKNRDFFASCYPDVNRLLEQCACPYHIDITEKFLNIVHSPTGEVAHPVNGLDLFAETLGDPDNAAWKELTCFLNRIPSDRFKHGRLLSMLHDSLLGHLSHRQKRIFGGEAFFSPPSLKGGFSPPVVFLGIFHGLHIDSFLSNSDTTRIMLIEPEPDRFMVSCYFLDYSEIQDRFGRISLCIGSEGHDEMFRDFFAWHNVSAQVWTRVLPGYVSPAIAPLVAQLEHFQRVHLENVRPFDPDLEGISNTFRNLSLRLPLLSQRPQLTRRARIVVVGSGPSLENDIEWLKENQRRVIIFAVHSAVRILTNHGVTPDFQFAIDIHLGDASIENLQLLPHIPLVSTSKINKEWFGVVERICLVETDVKASAVRFGCYVKNIYPTTGNLAIGFAIFCKPAEIFLVGLDFGFKSHGKRHANGGIYVQKGANAISHGGQDFLVKSNFGATGHVLSTTYLSAARQAAQAAIAECTEIEVFNLSDGAFMKGAKPCRSSTLQLEGYEEKEHDIKCISGVFKPASEGGNWKPYKISGEDLIETVKAITEDCLKMEDFDLKRFCMKIDSILVTIVKRMRERDGGVRVEVYLKFLLDVLALFYGAILLAETQEEQKRVYHEGLEQVMSVVKEISWPEVPSV